MRGLGFSLALAATLTLLSIGCGRSDLDQPFDASAGGVAGGGGHMATGGVGGTSSGGGQGGSGGVTGVGGGSPGRAGAGGIAGTGSAGSAGKNGSPAGSGGGTAGATGSAGAAGNSDGGLSGAAAKGGGGIAGTGGMGVPPVPITCGLQTCAAGAQTCCIQSSGGVTTESCVKTGTSCPGGATIGCLDGAACSDGNFCCLNVLNASTTCESVQTCAGGVGLILCAGDGDCPTGSPRCCRAGRVGFCRPGLCL